jgi:Cytochrome P450
MKGKDKDGHLRLFRHIQDSDMPESERSDERLAKEAQVLLGGGTASTARTLGFVSYYILANPNIRARLEKELKDTISGWPERFPSWADLKRLPYLQALIKEGLRYVQSSVRNRESFRMNLCLRCCYESLSYGVMHRLPRCSPDVPIQYKEWTIPIGVRTSLSYC